MKQLRKDSLLMEDSLVDGLDLDDEVDMDQIRQSMKLVPLPDIPDISSFDDIMASEDDVHPAPEVHAVHAAEKVEKVIEVKVPPPPPPPVLSPPTVTTEDSGPLPDFSLWTVEDDLLLKSAIEAGAAIEALARGAMRFSCQYSVREIRERWRAMLYDPEISSKAAVRMVEAETEFLESMRLRFPNAKKLQEFVYKRRQKSVRDTFYKRKRGMLDMMDLSLDTSEFQFGDGEMDSDDRAFSQMLDLLAAGGISALTGFDGSSPPTSPARVDVEKSLSPYEPPADEPTVAPLTFTAEQPTEVVQNPETTTPEPVQNVEAALAVPEAAAELLEEDRKPSPETGQGELNGGGLHVLLSSDDEDEEPQPKRQRVAAPVQENLMCTLNTQETDFGYVSPPPSPPASPSDVKSSDCANYSGFHEPADKDECQSTGEKRLVEDTYSPRNEEQRKVVAAKTEANFHDAANGADAEDKPEVESDSDMASFSDVEAMILDMDLDPGDNDVSARAESKRLYTQYRMTILKLEQSMGAAMQRCLTRKAALALFYGRHMRYFMTKPEALIGRTTQDNIVDIDLTLEGPANKVSRKQAIIKLSTSGVFFLKNLGKKVMYVNDAAVLSGQRAILSSNCLLEIGGLWFIFEMNKRLIAQRVKEMAS